MTTRIALAAGHHNRDGGNALEYAQTGKLCYAVAVACRALGMEVRSFTPGDGLGTRADGIWDLAREVVAAARDGWRPDIFLEAHTEGAGPTARGVFAIYPDWGDDVDVDVRDRLGPAAARAIAAATGLPVRGDGVLSERATGVGLTGYRLGIFGQTVPIKATCTRLIIEYGSHDSAADLALINAPGFYNKAGRATAQAFAEFLGVSASNAAE